MGSSAKDIRHIRTPRERRDGLWWMVEHAVAEQAVTLAAALGDHATSRKVAYLSRRLLDQRLDHLEECEDTIDAILDELRSRRPLLAEAASLHYLGGRTWASVADEVGVPSVTLYKQTCEALRGCKVAARR